MFSTLKKNIIESFEKFENSQTDIEMIKNNLPPEYKEEFVNFQKKIEKCSERADLTSALSVYNDLQDFMRKLKSK